MCHHLTQDGVLGAVWAPIQDGLFHQVPTEAFLPETPDDLRRLLNNVIISLIKKILK